MTSPKEIFWPQKVQNVFQILLSNFRPQIKLLKVTYAVHLYNQAIRPVWQLHCHLKERLPELKTPSNKETLRVLDWLQRQMAIFFSVDWLLCVFVCVLSQSCLTPMSSSSSGSSIHGIFQARILEWVAIPFSRECSWPGIQPGSPVLQQILYHLSYLGSSYTYIHSFSDSFPI